MTTTLTEEFVDCILSVTFQSVPAEVIDVSRQVVLDGLAVTLAGATEPLGIGRIATEYVKELGGAPEASVVAGGFKTSVTNAAYANGCMAHALDFDNTWDPLNHPTSPTLPAILAIAEKNRLSGAAVIEALVAAFEAQGRLRMAATGMATGKGFHKPGITGTIGATAAAIKLLGLDRTQALMAMGIAGSRAGSLSINTGSMTKSSHSGHAARMGVECGLLARKGWTASADVFGPGGFFDTFWKADAQPRLLVESFGAPFRMIRPGVGFKKHPSNYFTHRPIDAALALRREHDLKPQQIAGVEIRFPEFSYVDRPNPKTGLDGKFSVQYATAVALLDGEVTVDSFTNERRFAADVAELLPRVTLRPDASIPGDFNETYAVVTVSLKDGRTVQQKVDKLAGWCGSPLTREERFRKFYSCVKRKLAQTAADDLLGLVERLETLHDVTPIMDLVRC
jgi:2-methylcitrate dehydratase PrpD